jgi:hypothetical protein
LHIEKDNIGRELKNFLDGREAVPALSNDLDASEFLESKRDSTPSQGLVVDNRAVRPGSSWELMAARSLGWRRSRFRGLMIA